MSQTPVFPNAPPGLCPNPKAVTPSPKPPKRENVFSRSRDTREDRGSRQMKTAHNPQTLSHGR